MVDSKPIHVDVIGDAVDPRIEGGSSAKSTESLPELNEGLLCKVRSVGVVGGQPAKKSVDSWIEHVDQPYDGCFVPASCGRDQGVWIRLHSVLLGLVESDR